MLTHPSDRVTDQIICLVDSHIVPMRLEAGGATCRVEANVAQLEGRSQPKFTTGRWNPHHGSAQIATCHDTTVRGWDLRTMR